MLKSGNFVASHLEPHEGGELDDEQIQPNGVDLKVDEIYRMDDSSAVLGDEDYIKPEREEAFKVMTSELSDEYREVIDSTWAYQLTQGAYIVVYDEEIKIPYGATGFVFPRSRLLRTGAHLTTAVWDTGYEGRGEGALLVNQPTFIAPNMRIAQMVMVRSQTDNTYKGQHQGERLDEA